MVIFALSVHGSYQIGVRIREGLAMVSRLEHKEVEKKKTDKLSRIWSLIKGLIESQFTGYIKLNFTQGGIGRIEKFEEILKN